MTKLSQEVRRLQALRNTAWEAVDTAVARDLTIEIERTIADALEEPRPQPTPGKYDASKHPRDTGSAGRGYPDHDPDLEVLVTACFSAMAGQPKSFAQGRAISLLDMLREKGFLHSDRSVPKIPEGATALPAWTEDDGASWLYLEVVCRDANGDERTGDRADESDLTAILAAMPEERREKLLGPLYASVRKDNESLGLALDNQRSVTADAARMYDEQKQRATQAEARVALMRAERDAQEADKHSVTVLLQERDAELSAERERREALEQLKLVAEQWRRDVTDLAARGRPSRSWELPLIRELAGTQFLNDAPPAAPRSDASTSGRAAETGQQRTSPTSEATERIPQDGESPSSAVPAGHHSAKEVASPTEAEDGAREIFRRLAAENLTTALTFDGLTARERAIWLAAFRLASTEATAPYRSFITEHGDTVERLLAMYVERELGFTDPVRTKRALAAFRALRGGR